MNLVSKHAPTLADADAPYLEAHQLSLGDVRMQAYQNVDLAFARGGAYAICAEDKGGKTELLLTLAGRMHPTAGSCMVAGYDVCKLSGMRKVRTRASLAFFENVNDVERVLKVRTIASAELGLAGKRSNRAATEEFLKAWGLADVADQIIEDLPRPTYDLLGIALAMAHDPELLVVDEIERDMTEHEACKMADFLCALAHERGITVVCGVLDYDLATRFDDVACITDDARAQQGAYVRRHQPRRVA